MENIEIGARVTLVDRTGIGISHEMWQVVGIQGETLKIAHLKKDGTINKRRAIRKIKRQDIQSIQQGAEKEEVELEPLLEENNEIEAVNEPSKRRRIPTWLKNAPDALAPFIHEGVELVELLDAAQKLLASAEPSEETEALKRYIKVNRRFVRKKVFEW